jgi:Fe/S biogenesis protein NfuA
MFQITEAAKIKLHEMMEAHNKQDSALRVAIQGRGPQGFMYMIGFVDTDNQTDDDTVVDLEDLTVFIDPDTLPNIKGSKMEYVENPFQNGFKIDNPNPLWSDPLAMEVQKVLDQQVNPSIASHGGFVSLVEVKDNVAYVAMGGGCQGCGMAKVTLSQGVDVMIKDAVPEIVDIVDVTDHAVGKNPFYKSPQAGKSPVS